MKPLFIILLFLTSISLYGQQTVPSSSRYCGKYNFGIHSKTGKCGEIIVFPETDSTLLFYIYVCKGFPGFHEGYLYGRAMIKKEGIAFYESNDTESQGKGCKWKIAFSSKLLTITTINNQNECGFGYAVFADGNYKRRDRKVYDSFNDGSHNKIYFRKTSPEKYYE